MAVVKAAEIHNRLNRFNVSTLEHGNEVVCAG